MALHVLGRPLPLYLSGRYRGRQGETYERQQPLRQLPTSSQCRRRGHTRSPASPGSLQSCFHPATDAMEVTASGPCGGAPVVTPIHDVDVVITFDGNHHPTWANHQVHLQKKLSVKRAASWSAPITYGCCSWSTSFGGVVVSLEPKSAPSLLVALMPSDRMPPSSPCRADAVSGTS